MTTVRRALPMRRASETFEIAFGGLRDAHVITLGYYEDGGVGEIFINGGKSGEVIEAIARDAAILLSLGLQYGVPLTTIKRAITRNGQNEPSSIIGSVIDQLKE